MIHRILAALLLMLSLPAQAALQVAATAPNLGMLASEIGGDQVRVEVLAPPDRDMHHLEARPSMMAKLRNADLLVSVGADLEVGWLPVAIRNSGNDAIRSGQPGYFSSAENTDLIQKNQKADRSQGDVHTKGNPHFYLDPIRMAEVGHALANRLGELDPDNASDYQARAQAFQSAVDKRMKQWHQRVDAAPGVLLYHKDADYLMQRLDVPVLGYLEPLPGIPPTGQHLSGLVQDLKGKEAVVLYTDFQPSRAAEFIERHLDWPHHQLPSQVRPGSDSKAYFQLIDRWVKALTP